MVFQKQIVQQAMNKAVMNSEHVEHIYCGTYRQISARSFEEVDVLLQNRLDWLLLPCPTTFPPNPLVIDWKVNRNDGLIYI